MQWMGWRKSMELPADRIDFHAGNSEQLLCLTAAIESEAPTISADLKAVTAFRHTPLKGEIHGVSHTRPSLEGFGGLVPLLEELQLPFVFLACPPYAKWIFATQQGFGQTGNPP